MSATAKIIAFASLVRRPQPPEDPRPQGGPDRPKGISGRFSARDAYGQSDQFQRRAAA